MLNVNTFFFYLQVQFDEHETEKVCSIQINDDKDYEGPETFFVELTLPTYSLLGK